MEKSHNQLSEWSGICSYQILGARIWLLSNMILNSLTWFQKNFSELFSFPMYFLVHFYIFFEEKTTLSLSLFKQGKSLFR